MNVLSLFDGISCGQVALERVGIKVEKYFASEIDKYAIQVTQKNYPNTIQLGDVRNVKAENLPKIDMVIGGSPCTYWSIAKKDRETTSEGIGFELFMQYVNAVRILKPKYFLYENNHSIHKDIKEAITKELGVDFILINSSLVSAQQRKRCYWTNIPNVTQPEDKGILLKDILETGITEKDKSFCVDASYYKGGNLKLHCEKHKRTQVFEPVCLRYVRTDEGKQLRKDYESGNIKHGFNEYRISAPRGDGETNTLTTVTKDNMVVEPIRLGQIGKGGQGDRIYSVKGKSICLSANGGGRGAKTWLYKIDLPEGDYIIRKLTPVECERLQTLPDNYTEGISNTQRYKAIGNGWTVDVIAHILKNMEV